MPVRALEEGVPTAEELRARFNAVKSEVRRAALVPANAPSVIGQAVGSILAALSWAPKGFVPGEGLEEILARASYFIDQGDLRNCLKELQLVEGVAGSSSSSSPNTASSQMNDWTALAEDRLAVEELVGALTTAAALRHIAYAQAYYEDDQKKQQAAEQEQQVSSSETSAADATANVVRIESS